MKVLWRQIRYDFVSDWKRSCKWWVLLLLFLICDLVHFRESVNQYMGNLTVGIPPICYYWKIFGGANPIHKSMQNVTVSVEYLLFGIVILLLSTGYPSADYKQGGYRSMLACGSKRIWIIAKYLHSIAKALLTFFLCVAVIEVYRNVVDADAVISSRVIIEEMLGFTYDQVGFTTYGMMVIVCACLMASLLYTTLDIMVGSLYTLLIGSVVLVSSYFIDVSLLFGNLFMLVRITNHSAIWIAPMVVTTLLGSFIGYGVICKKDVLG